MQPRPLPLILAGLVATIVISLTSSMVHRPALIAALGGAERAARWPMPLWLIVLAAMLALYAAGLACGWLLWGGRK